MSSQCREPQPAALRMTNLIDLSLLGAAPVE
jgi:hypothetical protein